MASDAIQSTNVPTASGGWRRGAARDGRADISPERRGARGAGGRARVLDPGRRPGRQRDHHRPGRRASTPPSAQEQGIHVNARIKPVTGDDYIAVHDGDDLVRLARRGDDLHLLSRSSPGRPTASSSRSTSTRQAAGIKEEDFFPIAWDDDQLRRPHLGTAAGVRLQSALVEQGDPRRRATEDHRRARRPGRGVHDVRRRRQPDPGRLHPVDALQRTVTDDLECAMLWGGQLLRLRRPQVDDRHSRRTSNSSSGS